MFKYNEDSCSDSEEDDQISIQRSLVIQSMIDVDHLICSICHHLVWQPLACGSPNGCQNAFCSYCIKLWLQKCHSQGINQLLCPQCKRIFVSNKIPPIMKSILDSLIIKCPNNMNGCTDILTYNQIGKHVQTCRYKLKRCRGCHTQILIKSYQEHINNCQKYLIQCHFCCAFMPKIKYLKEHIRYDQGSCKNQRGYQCFQREINNLGTRVHEIEVSIEEMQDRCDKIQSITNTLMMGEPLPLDIAFYTTFQQHFAFPNPTLIKPSFNQTKQKFDFLHFYIINPINLDSFASIRWSIKITRMMGNILLGFCSTMNISSLDYIVNKYGELKRKDTNECKYKIIRKNEFNFLQGDIIHCRYLSLLNTIKIENQTKGQCLQLGPEEVKQFMDTGRIYFFISMDTLNDSLQFI